MQYGICHLSVVAIRAIAADSGEMTSQLLYGEHFKVLEQRRAWSKVRVAFDGFEGWVSNNQLLIIEKGDYDSIENCADQKYSVDLVSFVTTKSAVLLPILLGSTVNHAAILADTFGGTYVKTKKDKCNLVKTALLYLGAPFLWGGRTPFGLDSSGFTQMVYKINGYCVKRDALGQSTQGEALSFIEESEPGDLAFFDNSDGVIDHAGIIMDNNYIIHVYGKVRIDRIDHLGIFNNEVNQYTHKLRVIKKVL